MTKMKALDLLCRELNLSEVAVAAVSEAVQSLAEFERDKPRFMSGLKRADQLKKLSLQASDLRATLMELEPRNDWLMSYELKELGFPGSPNADTGLRHAGWNNWVLELLSQMGEAATASERKIPSQTRREGRVSLTMFYALRISNLANVVCSRTKELSFGRNGDFERLCDCIFEAANIPSRSEGAIRFVMKQKKAGLPLIWTLH